MPYYVHPKDRAPIVDPMSSDPYHDNRESAHAEAQVIKGTVTFIPSPDELSDWYDRERGRFRDKTYLRVPWHDDIPDRYTVHYAHLSIAHPGMVAYTKDAEHGILDRQTRTTPGRYLNKFYADIFDKSTIADYVAKVAAVQTELRIATSEDDIVNIYRHGPSSCMDGTHRFPTPVHPSAVYAKPADLAVAYYGTLPDQISQRCIVWPEKKVYTRIYGTGPLKILLDNAGYKNGSIAGAKIRRIAFSRGGDSYVMPYVDAYNSVSGRAVGMWTRDTGGKFFTLTDGPIDLAKTQGWIDLDPAEDDNGLEDGTCEHCGDHFQYDPDSESSLYCRSCDEDRWQCDHCEGQFFDDDTANQVKTWSEHLHRFLSLVVCDTCLENDFQTTCTDCGEAFVEGNEFNHEETLVRESHDLTDYCRDCAAKLAWCDHCDENYSIEEHPNACPSCDRPKDTATGDLLSTLPNDDIRRFANISLWSRVQVISNGKIGTKIGDRSIKFDRLPTDRPTSSTTCCDVTPDTRYRVLPQPLPQPNTPEASVESPF